MRSSTTAISEYLSLWLRSTVATRATWAWRDVGREAACADDAVRKGRQVPIAVSTTAGRNRTLRTTELYVAKGWESERYASAFLPCDAVAGLLGTAEGPRRALVPVLVTSFVAYRAFRSVDGTWVGKKPIAMLACSLWVLTCSLCATGTGAGVRCA